MRRVAKRSSASRMKSKSCAGVGSVAGRAATAGRRRSPVWTVRAARSQRRVSVIAPDCTGRRGVGIRGVPRLHASLASWLHRPSGPPWRHRSSRALAPPAFRPTAERSFSGIWTGGRPRSALEGRLFSPSSASWNAAGPKWGGAAGAAPRAPHAEPLTRAKARRIYRETIYRVTLYEEGGTR